MKIDNVAKCLSRFLKNRDCMLIYNYLAGLCFLFWLVGMKVSLIDNNFKSANMYRLLKKVQVSKKGETQPKNFKSATEVPVS